MGEHARTSVVLTRLWELEEESHSASCHPSQCGRVQVVLSQRFSCHFASSQVSPAASVSQALETTLG